MLDSLKRHCIEKQYRRRGGLVATLSNERDHRDVGVSHKRNARGGENLS